MGLGSEIRDPEKTYSGSRGHKGTGFRIRTRNTGNRRILNGTKPCLSKFGFQSGLARSGLRIVILPCRSKFVMWTQRIPLAPVIHAEVCQEVRKSVIRHACAIHRLCITGPQLLNNRILVESSVADPDPGSGAFLTPGSGIGFFRIPDPKPICLRAK